MRKREIQRRRPDSKIKRWRGKVLLEMKRKRTVGCLVVWLFVCSKSVNPIQFNPVRFNSVQFSLVQLWVELNSFQNRKQIHHLALTSYFSNYACLPPRKQLECCSNSVSILLARVLSYQASWIWPNTIQAYALTATATITVKSHFTVNSNNNNSEQKNHH